MDLNTVWFVIIAALFAGFFFLEGFDYGVGMWLPFLGKKDEERRVLFNAVGPFWDANEVWMIAAGGAMFAAFPHWYATLFSAFYIPLVLMLFALILHGVAFEFRSQDDGKLWRAFWDWAFFGASVLLALLWGVVLGNLSRGLPIDEDWNYAGTMWQLLSPQALLSGVAFVALLAQHGAIYLTLKLRGDILERANNVASKIWWTTFFLAIAATAWNIAAMGEFSTFVALAALLGTLMIAGCLGLVRHFTAQREAVKAFVASGAAVVLTPTFVFAGLYPRVLPSTLDIAWNLTIVNASATPYTLRVMTIVAAVCMPLVILYQVWAYRLLRGRIGLDDQLEY